MHSMVNVLGYRGVKYNQGQLFSLKDLYYSRLPDRRYSVLDKRPFYTDAFFVVDVGGGKTDVLWLHVVEPHREDNSERNYALASAMTAERDENGRIIGRPVEPREIEDIVVTVGQPVVFGSSSNGEQIVTGTVLLVVAYDRGYELHKSVAEGMSKIDPFARFRS